MVDDPRVCAAGKSDQLMGVCVHPMAQPRLGRWPAGVTVPAPSQPWSGDAPATCFRPTAPAPHHQPLQARRRAGAGGPTTYDHRHQPQEGQYCSHPYRHRRAAVPQYNRVVIVEDRS